MKLLRREIDSLLDKAKVSKSVIELLESENDIFPFSVEGRKIAYLMDIGFLSYSEYLKIYNEYSKRNQYLELFDMAPRTFGETWGEQHVMKLFPDFTKATKENMLPLYPSFDGEFDLCLDGNIRVEVKACRANSEKDKKLSLAGRAYMRSEAKENKFKYHYQQLKPSCCDVFIWIGVCKDELIYWVLTSEELRKTGKLGSQHRNENTGVAGIDVFEGQVFMTEEELAPYCVKECDLVSIIRLKCK